MVQFPALSITAHGASPADAAEILRRKIPRTETSAAQKPVELVRQATPPGGLRYALVSFWEERCLEVVKCTTIDKIITLHWELMPDAPAIFTYKSAPPILQKPNLTALEKAFLLLATLYQRLEADATPAGQLLMLRNHAEILGTWTAVQEELIRRSGGADEVTQGLLVSVSAQLQHPEAMLASLRHDYTFAFLLPDLYRQRFESDFCYEQAQEFPLFFTDTSLWFQEQLAVAAPVAQGRAMLRASGYLNTNRTNPADVAGQVAAARQLLRPDAPVAPISPDALRFGYEATAELDAATGWPVRVEASVRCGVAEGYSKEYFIRLEQQPFPL